MNVYFYNNKSDIRWVSKSLTPVSNGAINCQLKEPCDILSPEFFLARASLSNYKDVNYMYVPSFGRYYAVKVTLDTAGTLHVSTIQTDPLMSFANGIRSIYCTVIRQQNVYNKYFVDNELAIRQTKQIQWVQVGKYNAGQGIYLTVDGGSDQ